VPVFRLLPRSAQVYVILVLILGLATLPLGWWLHPPKLDAIPTLVYLAIGTQIAAFRPIPWRTGRQTVVDPLLIATGLTSPGFGIAVIAWIALFDGRVPGKTITWWEFFFNRAMMSTAYALPSLVLANIGDSWLPLRTIAYVVASVGINYLIAAFLFSRIRKQSLWATVAQNVGPATLMATLVLSFAGGILYLLLQAKPFPVGYIIAPGLFGFVLATRGNVADAQRQTLLKEQTLDLAAQALDARDRYTESHSIRVSEMAGRLGEHLDLGDRDVELIRTAGSLHDLGKIGVRDDILNKAGPLSEEEWDVMRKHPDIGADMIAQHSALAEVAPLVRHHHERWDGTGYPAGLKGDVIPFGARILSVADSYDTITGVRLYRKSLMTPIEAVEDISRRANHWYDPNIVDALREIHGLAPLEVEHRPEIPRQITALRVIRSNPGFSNLVSAIAISSLGDPLTQVATLVTIFAATRDALFVALGFMVQGLGTVLMSTVLGGIADKFPRRPLVVSLELLRAGILVATAVTVTRATWWLIMPILFGLACINAIVQPARQAAIPTLVARGQIGKANAIVTATNMLAGAVGFALAGALLLEFQRPHQLPTFLFVADAATFVVAAVVVWGIPSLGGGVMQSALVGALGRSWAVVAARPHLIVGGLASFLLPISYPAILALAYRFPSDQGGQLYSILELVLSLGIFAGSLLVSRFTAIGTMRTVGGGLFLTGAFAMIIWWLSSSGLKWDPVLFVAMGVALFIASVGNPIYAVGNQTAILDAADPSNRGSLMATRFGLVQTATIAGTAVGGVITQAAGPGAAYGVLGVGLVVLALVAIAAGRSTVNPLHGAAYEDSRYGRAKS
jgi:putative nucleotidyltransferase with HDIG domain